jgi:hypothetical protein
MLSNLAFDYFASLYDPKFCSEMIRFCSLGRSPEAYAAEIDCTPEVFAYWSVHHIEFEIALHISFWKSYSWWEEQSMNPDRLDQRGFAAIFNAVMKNRFKWKDGNEDLHKLVKRMTTAELETLAKRLLTQETKDSLVQHQDEE